MKKAWTLCLILLGGLANAEPSHLYLTTKKLDFGHSVSLDHTSKYLLLNIEHTATKYRNEHYTIDTILIAYRLNNIKAKYSLFCGFELGYEQHKQSTYFYESYGILYPEVSIWKKLTKDLAIGATLKAGKGYNVIKKDTQAVKNPPAKGFDSSTQVGISISIKLY